jgi:hypothetical protein
VSEELTKRMDELLNRPAEPNIHPPDDNQAPPTPEPEPERQLGKLRTRMSSEFTDPPSSSASHHGIDRMNMTDLIDRVAAEHGVARDHVRKIFDSTFGAITAAAMRGDEVALSGFGK